MTLSDFFQLLDDRDQRGTLHNSDGVEEDILETYSQYSKSLKNEFFQRVEENLDRDVIQSARKCLGLLVVSPFDETDHSRFQ